MITFRKLYKSHTLIDFMSLENICDNLYNEFACLPKKDKAYHDWFGGHKNRSSYRVIIDKTPSRKKSWDNLLCNYFNIPWLDLLKNNNFETKDWNTFFHSGIKIIDKDNNRKIIAYTPWYSPLIRVFFGGGDLIITKIKENYNPTPLTTKIKKTGNFCANVIKKSYMLYDSFATKIKEGYRYFKKRQEYK